MNCIITGCNGFLGTHIINEIKNVKPDWLIYGVDKEISDEHQTNFAKILLEKKINWMDYLKDKNPDIIFHSIGVYKTNDKEIMLDVNLKQSINLFESIIDLDIDPIIVIIGTAAQYGNVNPKDNPIVETHKQNPTSFYGYTKKWQEQMALFYNKNYGIKVICTRPSNFIGKGLPSKLLQSMLTEKFSTSESEVHIQISSKESIRDYIDIRDASQALIKLSESKKSIGMSFNISSSNGISNELLIEQYSKVSKKKAHIIDEGLANPLKITLSNNKLKTNIDWDIKYTLEESIKWNLEK